MAKDARQKIDTLCKAMGLTHRIATAKGWSRFYVCNTDGSDNRQIGRAWQREGEGWTLDMIARELEREADRIVTVVRFAQRLAADAERDVALHAMVVSDLEAKLTVERKRLVGREELRDAARASLDKKTAAMTDRERAILAALTEVQS